MFKLEFKFDTAKAKEYALVAFAYLLISFLFFWPILQGIATVVPGTGGDTYQGMWELWWVPYSLFTLKTSPYFTYYVFYPVGANLATQTLAPIAGLVSTFFQWISIAFSYNMIFLIGFVLSGLFTYLLAFRFTKHKAASFIAGFIYAFSPIHTIQSFGHLQFMNIEFIPLFLLFFLKMIDDKKHGHALAAGVSFVLLTFMGDIEQGLMTIFLVFFILIYMLARRSERSKVLNGKFLFRFVEMLAVMLIIGSPAILAILGSISSSTLSTVNAQASTSYNLLYSPDLLSFFIPSSMNSVLGFASSAFASINAPAEAERTVYAGYTIIILAFLALAYEYKEKFAKTGIILFPLALFILLSLGPYLQINGSVSQVPGLYLLYHQIPFFNVLREPGRFDIMIELFLALLAAFGFVKLEEKYSGRMKNGKLLIAAAFLLLLVIEYNTIPLSGSAVHSAYQDAQISSAYYELANFPANFTVLILPALPNYTSSTPALYPGMALYYQTAFKKPLVGGYTTRYNTTQIFSLMNIPLVASTYYLAEGQGVSYGSPIIENYTNATILLLGAYNVGFVSVTRQAYNTTQQQLLLSYLFSVFGAPNIDNTTFVFSTANAITQNAGRSIVAYTPVLIGSPLSLWQPGWLLCGSSSLCSADVLSSWLSVDPVYINFFSPKSGSIRVSLQALSPDMAKTEYVYLNGQPSTTLSLNSSLANYTFNVSATAGLNQLIFYSQKRNATAYLNIGIKNMTFKAYP